MGLKPFRLALRLLLPLAFILALFAYAAVPLMENLTLRWALRDLDMRSQLVASSLQDPLAEYVGQRARKKIAQLFDRAILDERLYALAFCDASGTVRYKTATYPESLGCHAAQAHKPGSATSLMQLPQGPVHVAASPVLDGDAAIGRLVLVHDMSFIERRSEDTRKYAFSFFAVLALVVALVTVFIAQV
ncbi:trehalose-6-phosphate synthase, partial [Oxalobacteraceae bacterium OM1]